MNVRELIDLLSQIDPEVIVTAFDAHLQADCHIDVEVGQFTAGVVSTGRIVTEEDVS